MVALLIITALAITALAACGGESVDAEPGARPPNLVLIVLDTTRPDLLSAYGHPRDTTPFLEEFAASGTRYDRAYSTSGWTLPAHASLFTGAPPEVHGATQRTQRLTEEHRTLFEELEARGYETGCVTNNPWVTLETGLARGTGAFMRPAKTKFLWLKGRLPTTSPIFDVSPSVLVVRQWLERTEAPFFLFVNLMEPHEPYAPVLDAARPFLPVESEAELREMIEDLYPRFHADRLIQRHYAGSPGLSGDELETLRGLYEGTLRMLDRTVREIVEAVDAESEETLVLIVSDHGENLGDHGHLGHMFNLYDSNLRVVFMARGPGFEAGRVDETVVGLADAHATLLAAAGSEAPTGGVDLRAGAVEPRVLSAFLDYPVLSLRRLERGVPPEVAERFRRKLFAAIGPRYKLIADSRGGEEVFDLIADPLERHPLSAGEVDAAALLPLRASVERSMAAIRVRDSEMAGQGPPELDPELEAELRSLGYVR